METRQYDIVITRSSSEEKPRAPSYLPLHYNCEIVIIKGRKSKGTALFFFFYRWEMHLRRPLIRKASALQMSGTVGLTGETDPTH